MNLFGKMQKLGKALMLPIAALPAAGLLLRFGVLLEMPFMQKSGEALFSNLPVLFAIGIAIGLAKGNAGAAGLAGAIGNFVITDAAKALNPDFNMGVLPGMVAGVMAGVLYNKYHNVKFPDWLQFFGGKRFVPIITSFLSIPTAFIMAKVYPFFVSAITSFGSGMEASGAMGAAGYGFLNRLLLPTGLHHIINSIMWTQVGTYTKPDGTLVTGDLLRFLEGDPTAGRFLSGMYLCMMFGAPAIALAMYVTSKKENKKVIGGALLSVGLTAFITGVTEPLEFMFMFLAPGLYVVHAILTAIGMAVAYSMEIYMAFGFSGGLTDFLIYSGQATNAMKLIPLGIGAFAVYFVVFTFIIKKFDLKTPGREEEDESGVDSVIADKGVKGLAKSYIEALGGPENFVDLDSCITRLRLTLADTSIVKDSELKALGASGVIRPSKTTMQVIVGTKVELVCGEMEKILAGASAKK